MKERKDVGGRLTPQIQTSLSSRKRIFEKEVVLRGGETIKEASDNQGDAKTSLLGQGQLFVRKPGFNSGGHAALLKDAQ